MTYALFLAMLISYFMRLPARVELLADLRIDLLLVIAVVVAFFLEGHYAGQEPRTPSGSALLTLCSYIVATFPFTRWPGSVFTNAQNFSRALLFYVVPACAVSTPFQLRLLVGVFLGLQCFRVVEPLSLHLTRGYWGSATHAGGGEMLARLAGSPYDVINPNGLAFVIVTIISIAHFWPPRKGQPIMHLLYWGAVALLLYALVLSQSRTGYLALVVVLLIIVIKSDNRAIGLALVAVCLVGLVSQLDTLSIERILSLARSDVRFAGSARSRIDGVFADLQVALSGPIFGYGIGTSLEANVNLRGTALPAHNLYVEILQELGFIGVALFLWYMVAIARTIRSGLQESRHLSATASSAILHGLDAWYWMNLLFSFASYGLSSYEWYLIGGLAVAAYTQQVQSAPSESREAAPSAAAIPGPWEQ